MEKNLVFYWKKESLPMKRERTSGPQPANYLAATGEEFGLHLEERNIVDEERKDRLSSTSRSFSS